MRFSILIPMYNVERYIGECLDSCLNQTFGDFEIIIINDGSKDGSAAIVEGYKDERIKLYHKENAGLLMARRDAIPKACGEYLIFLDSDDKLRADCLEKINGILKSGNDLYDVVLYNLYNWNSNTGEEKIRKPVFDNGKIFSKENKRELLEHFLFTSELNNLVIKAVKRELIQADDTPYSKMGNSSYGEDKLQSFYIFDKAENVYYSAEPLYYYRNNPTSITNANVSPEKIAKQLAPHIEKLTNEYLVAWDFDTPKYRDMKCTKRLLFLRSVFFQCFNRCGSAKKRRESVRYDWFALISEENLKHMRSKRLTKLQRFELKALYRKRYFVLNALRILRLVIRR